MTTDEMVNGSRLGPANAARRHTKDERLCAEVVRRPLLAALAIAVVGEVRGRRADGPRLAALDRATTDLRAAGDGLAAELAELRAEVAGLNALLPATQPAPVPETAGAVR